MKSAIITMTIFMLAGTGCEAAIGDGGPGLEETLFAADNGIRLDNGLTFPNGALLSNGTVLANGLKLSNGVDATNGIRLDNGLKLSNGIAGPYYAPPPGSGLEQWIDVDPPMRKRILRYLIECSLPYGTEVQLLYRGQLEVLGRGVGELAPGLARGEMTLDERQMVSACLLARVNARGEVVTVDLYGPMTVFAAPAGDPANSPEAAFYGDLFAATPAAFVCSGAGSVFALDRSCIDGDCGVMDYASSCAGAFKQGQILSGCGLQYDGYYLACRGGGTVWKYPMTTYLGGVGSSEI